MNEWMSSLILEGIYGVSWLQPERYPRDLQPMYQLLKALREGEKKFIWKTVSLAVMKVSGNVVGSKPLRGKAYEGPGRQNLQFEI